MPDDDRLAVRAPGGTHDVLWPESTRWEELVARFAARVERAGYGLAHTPIFEDVKVFRRGIGESSDVVGKEMYEFEDRGGRALALRPEGTAPIVRAFVQHRPTLPWKAWYATPAFRYERPQAGRYRQHHQLGVEVLGPADPDLDVEVVALADGLFRSLGLGRFVLAMNSMGDGTCRPGYLAALRHFLDGRRGQLCPEHAERIDASPLRVLDCKRPACRAATAGAPRFVDYLCDACRHHFERVQSGLDSIGVPHTLDHRLVRGFDYYTRTPFEFSSQALESAQNGIGGGGRYDGLVEMLGGPPTPGIGFGIGIERLLLACDAEQVFPVDPPALDVFVVDVTGGEAARDLTAELRRAGLRADRAFDGRSMKSQLKSADRSRAVVAVIVGPDEAAAGEVTLRSLRGTAGQHRLERAQVVGAVRQTVRRQGDDLPPTVSEAR
ncbi:MAG: histidine--tRNA ligase [Acidimicrobiales bacterium]